MRKKNKERGTENKAKDGEKYEVAEIIISERFFPKLRRRGTE